MSPQTIIEERSQESTRIAPGVRPVSIGYRLLYFGFIILPLIAGFDKFFHVLTDWHKYLSPIVSNTMSPELFMRTVGVIEIAAALIVAVRPRLGGTIVGLWLWAIIINLLTTPGYLDIALRDFGLSLGAFALAAASRE